MRLFAGWFNHTEILRIKYSYLMVALVVTALLSSVAKAKQLPQSQAATTSSVSQASLLIQVIDKQTQEPLSGVTLDFRISPQSKLSSQITDSRGQATIALPKKVNSLTVITRKEGFITRSVSWGEQELNSSSFQNYMLALESGLSIGGLIQNEQGQPIENATVFLLVPRLSSEKERVSIHDYPVKTNAEGRWQCDIMPVDLEDVLIRLSHPAYVSDNHYGATPKPSMKQLRDMTGVMVMKKGFTVRGQVRDTKGNPIPKARVMQGSDRNGSHFPEAEANTEGLFEFNNVGAGPIVLTVQAKGYAPDLKEIKVGENTKPVEFSLKPAQIIKGRIVDPNGKPVSGAFVSADTWRGHRSLEWRVDTDSEGRFVWNDAPADVVLFDMGKSGFMSIRRKALTASDEEYVLTMSLPLTIKGTVTDAKTGQPIEKFKVIPGFEYGNDQKYWDCRNAKTFSNGKYEIKKGEPRDARLLRIEVEGYKPSISRSFNDNEVSVVFDFKLEKADWKTGTVLSQQGKPLADVQVAIATPSQQVMVRGGRFDRIQMPKVLTTNAQGQFILPIQLEPYKLILIHDSGCAIVSEEEFKDSPDITLTPWGRVDGTMYIGGKPANNERVSLTSMTFSHYEAKKPRYSFSHSTTVSSDGSFTFQRVFPGQWKAAKEVHRKQGRFTCVSFSHATPVEVHAGQTSHVTIGGTGRPVIGQVVLPANFDQPVNFAYGNYSISTEYDKLSVFDAIKEMSREAKRKWYENWKKSEEGKAVLKARENKSRSYQFIINDDGRFRVEDIPAGTYVLKIHINEPPKTGQCYNGDLIGRIQYEFAVPEMDGDRSDEPLDLGSLELELLKG